MNILTTIRDAWIASIILSLLPQVVHQQIKPLGILLAVALGVGYAFGFALNNYYDADLDKQHPDKAEMNYFVNNEINKKQATLIIGTIYIFFLFVFTQFNLKGILTLIILSLVMWSYSTGPLHFKTRIFFDLFIHGIFVQTAPYFVTVYLLELSFTKFDNIMMVLLFLSSVSGQIAGQIRDMDVDQLTHTTTSIIIGRKGAKLLYKLIFVFMILVLLLGFVINVFPIFIYPLFTIAAIFLISRRIEDNNITWKRRYLDVVLGTLSFIYLAVIVVMSKLDSTLKNSLLSPL